MGNEATKQIMNFVHTAKERAEDAKRTFNSANSRIQLMASQSIDLFGGDAVSRVADIAAEVAKTCDSLYAALQSAIISLDANCRPLLNSKPDANAIEAVADLIGWLNSESEITNNFTASLNGTSVGGVASGRYLPSIECKMVQSFWESQHMNAPEVIEAQKKKKEQKESAYQSMVSEVEQKNREAEQKYNDLMVEHKKEIEVWERNCKEIEERRASLLAKAIESKRKEIIAEAELTYERKRKEEEEKIKSAEKNIASLTEEADKCNFFLLFKKAKLKKKITAINNDILFYKEIIKKAKNEYENTLKTIETTLKHLTKSMEQKISTDNPLPNKPTPPERPRIRSIAPEYYSNEDLRDDVMGALYGCFNQDGMSVGDILDELPVSPIATASAVTSILHSCIREGRVCRKEISGRAYFSVNGSDWQ